MAKKAMRFESLETMVRCQGCDRWQCLEDYDVMGADDGHIICNYCSTHFVPLLLYVEEAWEQDWL